MRCCEARPDVLREESAWPDSCTGDFQFVVLDRDAVRVERKRPGNLNEFRFDRPTDTGPQPRYGRRPPASAMRFSFDPLAARQEK